MALGQSSVSREGKEIYAPAIRTEPATARPATRMRRKGVRLRRPDDKEMLADLFAGKSQLIVYHFMLGPDDEAGCKTCSFWTDNFNGIDIHLAHRDVASLQSHVPHYQNHNTTENV
jgi:predicted dithiol-disulfide oxidoreductase (DUF899 family)